MLSSSRSTFLSILVVSVIAQLAGAVALLVPRTDPLLVPTLKQITTVSQNMATAISAVSSFGSVLVISEVAANITNIDNLVRGQFVPMGASQPYDDQDAVPVVTAFDAFVNVHQKTLQVLIDKYDMFAVSPVAIVPIAVTLIDHQKAFETFGDSLLGLLPTQQDAVTRDIQKLDESISKAVSMYPL